MCSQIWACLAYSIPPDRLANAKFSQFSNLSFPIYKWMNLNYPNFNILWTLTLGIIHTEGALKFEPELYADMHLSDLERNHFEPLVFLNIFRLLWK